MNKTTRQKSQNIPELRFPEFDGAWEEKKLGEMFKIIDGDRGANYPKSSDFYDEGFCLFLNAKNVTKNGFLFEEKHFISKDKDQKLGQGKLVRDDVVLTTRGTTGQVAYYDDDVGFDCVRINSGMVLLRSKLNCESQKFLYALLRTKELQNRFRKLSFGSAQPQLTVKTINNLKLVFPTLSEQEKIAGFLGGVDEWIENLKIQKEKLEEYKRGMMQKIFSQEVRFKDDEGDFPEWEEKKISDVFDIIAGKSKSAHMSKNGRNIIVDMGGIASDGRLIAKKKTDYSEDFLTVNDLVMPKDDIGGGNIIGRVALLQEDKKYVCGDHVYKLSIKEGVRTFFFYAVNSFEINKSLRRKANGTAQLGLSKKEVENQLVPFPKVKEQQKIAGFLSSIDALIEAKNAQIIKAETWKKGLLQKMFV